MDHLDDFADALVLVSTEGRVLAWNREAEALFGTPVAQALGRPFQELIGLPASGPTPWSAAAAAPDGRLRVDVQVVARDRPPLRVDLSVRMVPGAGEGPARFAICARDVTLLRCREQARVLATRFRGLLDAAPDALLIAGPEGRILLANREAQRLFGYGADEITGLAVDALVPAAVRGRHPAHRAAFFKDPGTRAMGAGRELSGLRRDGSEFPAEISLSPLDSDVGPLVAAAVRDVTERRRVEARFRGLLEAAPDAMVIVDEAGRIVLVNSQTERLFGYRREELLGQSVGLLIPEGRRAGHAAYRESYHANPVARPMGSGRDLAARRKDGSEFPAEISLSPLDTEEGRLVSAAVRDISERLRIADLKREAAVLAEGRRRAEEQSRHKSEFLANMSHELRTPLNSIVGFAELIHDGKVGPVNPEQREYLGDVLASARHLVQLINDLLDLSKVEAGRIELAPQRLELLALVNEVRDALRPLSRVRGLAIEVEIDPELRHVHGDPGRLRQVLWNYLSNAIKFTPEQGHVVVRAVLDAPAHFRLEVEDDGIGIAVEDQPRLFVSFQQLDAGAAKRHGGTGLGLALTRRLVEAMGGRVGLESAPGRGSRFFAVLPRDIRGMEGK
ncbi:MAG: PAS domain S-box protein [Vicinamibacteria bacterium]|jgi:protein-histidine pros-kinase|nr:PAS domain S-box protein [Vicinamibacteria bacterium]